MDVNAAKQSGKTHHVERLLLQGERDKKDLTDQVDDDPRSGVLLDHQEVAHDAQARGEHPKPVCVHRRGYDNSPIVSPQQEDTQVKR